LFSGEFFSREQGICDIIFFQKYFSKDDKNLPQKNTVNGSLTRIKNLKDWMQLYFQMIRI
jgi:hypothetical protein